MNIKRFLKPASLFLLAAFFTASAYASVIRPGATFEVTLTSNPWSPSLPSETGTGTFTIGNLDTALVSRFPTAESVFDITSFSATFSTYTFSTPGTAYYSAARNSLSVLLPGDWRGFLEDQWWDPASFTTIEFFDQGSFWITNHSTGQFVTGQASIQLLTNGPEQPAAVPEPNVLALAGLGLFLCFYSRRRSS